jgi:phosphoglycerate dehydrogenase-like enzyme
MKVLVSSSTEQYFGDQIKSIDSSIELISINPDNSEDPAWEEIKNCDVFFLTYEFMFAAEANPRLEEPLLNLCKQMDFIQTGYAGTDSTLIQSIMKYSSKISNASGIHAIPIANYVFAQMLRWNKRIDKHIELQNNTSWEAWGGDGELTYKTILILGYGGIGIEVGRLAKSFGMNVVATKRSFYECNYADEIHRPDKILELLPHADFVVCCLPASEETDDTINKETLSVMKNTSMLINVGRGNAVNEEALIEALNSGTIASAALDTTKIEPLPKSSGLWKANNCFISSHDSAHSLHAIMRMNELFCSNLSNYLNNLPIKNLI